MKNNKNLFPVLIALLTLLGCNDAIDIDQKGRLDAAAAFQSVDDLQAGLFGVYDQFDITPDIAFQSIFTDELSIGFDNGGQGLSDYGFVLNAGSTAPATFWLNGYVQLNYVNRLIGAAENLPQEAIAEDPESYRQILGEAYTLRAWGHFILLSYFSTDYTDDEALSIINLDFVPSIDQQLLRNTNGETFDLIEADLGKAGSLLNQDLGVKRINADFVTALRARIAAYRGNEGGNLQYYQEAANLSQALIDRYPLSNRAEYEAMFLDDSDGEVIFKLERTNNDNYDVQGATGTAAAGGYAGSCFAFVDATIAGSPYFEMGRSLYNLLDQADIRYNINVDPSSLIDPDYAANQDPALDILVIRKYPGSEGQPLMNDLKVFRVSEMYLIRAEAAVALGDLGLAASLLKDIRDARFGSDTELPVFGNKTAAYGAILDERRIELCFEGHRYLDLKRLGARANKSVLKDAADCAFNGACTLPADDHRFTLPLPSVEFNGNPGLRQQQNPGY